MIFFPPSFSFFFKYFTKITSTHKGLWALHPMLCCAKLSHYFHVRLCVVLWTVACQASLSMGFSSQEHWRCHALFQRIFPTQGLNPCLLGLLHCQAGTLSLAPPGKPRFSFVEDTEASWWRARLGPTLFSSMWLRYRLKTQATLDSRQHASLFPSRSLRCWLTHNELLKF